MPEVTSLSSRKSDHIRINLEEDVQSGLGSGLRKYHFVHQAVPELNLSEIDLSQELFGKPLAAPVLISSMTGGTPEARKINQNLARAAQACSIPMGVGSQRAAIADPALAYTFRVRDVAPDILLFANLGAIQLNYGFTVNHCRKAVDMIQANALILHLNGLQEALQPEGEARFSGLLKKIEQVCNKIDIPVIAKEVGWGISIQAAKKLIACGVSAIDVAGAGGTSWSQVEMHRIPDESLARVAAAFADWGIPTAESVRAVRQASASIPIIASGGIRDGVDIAKCIALGACLGGMAGPFLKAALESTDEVIRLIHEYQREVQVCMFAAGAANLSELHNTPLITYI